MRYPTLRQGTFNHVELRLLPDSNGEHNDSAHQGQPAEQWRNINMLVLVRGGMDGPDIQNLLLMGIVESLVGKGKTAENNEENATPNERLHIHCAGG